MSRKIFSIVLLMATAIWAVVSKSPLSNKDLQFYLQHSYKTSTVVAVSPMPMVVDGKYRCAYVGSVYGPMEKDFICVDAYVYHLVQVVANHKNSLDCYYDYEQFGGNFSLTFFYQKECPDILVSYSGFRFFAAVYFDEVDDYQLYFSGMEVPKQIFQGDFERFPKVQSQIRYRQKHMLKEKAKKEIVF